MSRHTRLITALLALIFCIGSLTMLSTAVYAEDSQVSEGGDSPEDPVIPDPQDPITPDPADPDPVTPDPVTPDPVTPDPVTPDPVTPDPATPDPVTPGDGGTGDNSGDNSGGDNSGGGDNTPQVYYDGDGNEHNNQDDVYVGGGQSYVPPVSTAPSVPLYDTKDNKVDVDELSNSDWDDIRKSLTQSSNKKTVTDTQDFGFIQKNTAKEDNGHLILYAGIGMLVLSAAGFAYLIISAVVRRKKMAASYPKSGPHGDTAPRFRDSKDYGDGYKTETSKPAKKTKGGKRYK